MTIRLSPMDYYFFRPGLYSMRFLFEFQAPIATKSLCLALGKLQSVVPAASARLISSGDEIVLRSGYEVPIRELAFSFEPDLREETEIEPFVELISNSEGEPLVRFTIVRTPTRTLLGVGFSHILGDGTSLFHMLRELSRAYRGLEPEQVAFDDRNILPLETSVSGLYQSTGYTPELLKTLPVETVRVSYNSLGLPATRKAAHRNGKFVTNNDLIMADLVKRFHRDFEDERGVTLVRCPVDYRPVLNLPKGFFGNAILDARTEFTQEEILESSLVDIAVRIRSSIRMTDHQSIVRALSCLDAFRREKGKESFQNVGCPGLVVTNLMKVPLQDLNFGGGPPLCFYPVGMFPRLAVIQSQGGVEEIVLRKPKAGMKVCFIDT